MGNFTGAIKFNPLVGASSIENYGTSNSSLLGYTSDVDLAPDSTLWFTSSGLVRFNPKERTWDYWQGSNTRLSVSLSQMEVI